MKTGIVVFDLCSSTEIIEKLQAKGKIGLYNELFGHIETLINCLSQHFGCQIYKFLGDGFILTVNPETTTDEVILLCSIIGKISNNLLKNVVIEELDFKPKRIGFTFGYDTGEVFELSIKDRTEFTGKVINLSSRLQSGLSGPDDINKLFISHDARQGIQDPEIKKFANSGEKERTFKNIDFDRPIRCYLIDLYDKKIDQISKKISKRKYPVRYQKVELPESFQTGSTSIISGLLGVNNYEKFA